MASLDTFFYSGFLIQILPERKKERKLFWSNCFCFDEKRFWTEIFEAGNLKPFSESILVSQLEINFRTLSVELNFSNLFFSGSNCRLSIVRNAPKSPTNWTSSRGRTRRPWLSREHEHERERTTTRGTWSALAHARHASRPSLSSLIKNCYFGPFLFLHLLFLFLTHTHTHTHAHTLSIVLALPFIGFPTLTSTSTLPRTPQHTLTHVLWTPPDDSACSRLLLHIRYLSLSHSASQLRLNERNFTHISGFSSLPIYIFNISARSSDFQRNATCASSSS